MRAATRNPGDVLEAAAAPAMALACVGLRKEYAGRAALDLDRLDVPGRETLAVVGPSGAGKSTLLRLIALLERPDSGELRFGLSAAGPISAEAAGGSTATGAPVDPWGNGWGEAGRVTLRRQMGFVTQKTVMFTGTVAENVAYGLGLRGVPADEVRRRVGEALETVGLEHAAGWPARFLSGGEAQRVALARALIGRPSIILLDEATANLDPANVGIIERIITGQRQRGTTIIMVTHNLGQARRLADRVLFLWEGRTEYLGPAVGFFSGSGVPRARAFVAGELVY